MTPEQKIRFDKILANPDHKSIVECHEYAIYEAMDSYAQSQSIAFAEWLYAYAGSNDLSLNLSREGEKIIYDFVSPNDFHYTTAQLYSQFIEHQSQ